jgi:hypothetical protein
LGTAQLSFSGDCRRYGIPVVFSFPLPLCARDHPIRPFPPISIPLRVSQCSAYIRADGLRSQRAILSEGFSRPRPAMQYPSPKTAVYGAMTSDRRLMATAAAYQYSFERANIPKVLHVLIWYIFIRTKQFQSNVLDMYQHVHMMSCVQRKTRIFPPRKKKIASAFDIAFGLFYAGHGSRASAWRDLRM